MLKKLMFSALIFMFAVMFAGMAIAANSTTQTVTFAVSAINEISVSGSPAALVISTATAGSQPDSVSNALTSYNITTNGSGKKITAAINSNMPTGVTLTVLLAPPTGGSSATKTLSTTAEDVVTGVEKVIGSGLTITYNLSATVAAGVLSSDTRTVTLTVTN